MSMVHDMQHKSAWGHFMLTEVTVPTMRGTITLCISHTKPMQRGSMIELHVLFSSLHNQYLTYQGRIYEP